MFCPVNADVARDTSERQVDIENFTLAKEVTVENQPTFFDFAAEVGLTKHIGGIDATEVLVTLCQIGEGKYLLDVGCGVGLGAYLRGTRLAGAQPAVPVGQPQERIGVMVGEIIKPELLPYQVGDVASQDEESDLEFEAAGSASIDLFRQQLFDQASSRFV